MMFLSKKASNKDQQRKTQMFVSFQADKSKNTEHVWQESWLTLHFEETLMRDFTHMVTQTKRVPYCIAL